MLRNLLFTGLLTGFLLAAGIARAHPLLDEGIVAYEEADFKGALRTFNLAARDADLSVEELMLLFEMRALVYHAMGNRTAMLMDLERLGALGPAHELSGLTPPPVRQAFEEIVDNGETTGVQLVVEEKSFSGKPFVVARVEEVPTGLVHHVALTCRIPPDGRWVARTAQGTRVRMPLADSGEHEGCEATAETRRGTVLFSASLEGQRLAPPTPVLATPELEPLPKLEPETKPAASIFQTAKSETPSDEPTATKKKKKWPWIVAASVVVVAGGVTAGVLLSQRSDSSASQSTSNGVTVSW